MIFESFNVLVLAHKFDPQDNLKNIKNKWSNEEKKAITIGLWYTLVKTPSRQESHTYARTQMTMHTHAHHVHRRAHRDAHAHVQAHKHAQTHTHGRTHTPAPTLFLSHTHTHEVCHSYEMIRGTKRLMICTVTFDPTLIDLVLSGRVLDA